MLNKKIGFIGAGKMATALIGSFLSTNTLDKKNIIASDKNDESLDNLKKDGVQTTNDNGQVVNFSDFIFIAVKPQDIDTVLAEIKDEIKNKVIISICAGVSIARLQKELGDAAKIVRVMPNVNCLVQNMAGGYAVNDNISDEEKQLVNEILNAGGKMFEVSEDKIDVITALSGSGPAFIAQFVLELKNAAAQNGLEENIADKLATQTLIGTAELIKQKKISLEELVKIVASKGGTTEAGLEAMVKIDFGKIVEAAVKRAGELNKN